MQAVMAADSGALLIKKFCLLEENRAGAEWIHNAA